MKELSAILRQLQQHPATPHALATLVTVEGSSYRRAGARLLINPENSALGSISGGCLEDDIRERARLVLANGTPQTVIYNTTAENDLVWGVGLGCQGVVRVFIERLPAFPAWAKTLQRNFASRTETHLSVIWECTEPALLGTHEAAAVAAHLPEKTAVFHDRVPPPIRLLVFGAGDDAQPLVRLAHELGWRVHVFDSRPAYANTARFPLADEVTVALPEAAASISVDDLTFAVIMTHRYRDDLPLMRALLPQNLPYLGLLGPKKRASRILDELAQSGFTLTPEMNARLHAPVGLDLGGNTPETVALSMLAEMQAVLAARDARPLRERAGPIHAR
jgi:xanthine/CO dehydrogenase XdhC/CoxF family maturation factor